MTYTKPTARDREIAHLLHDRVRPAMIRWTQTHDEPFEADRHLPDLPYWRMSVAIDVDCAAVHARIARAFESATTRLDELTNQLQETPDGLLHPDPRDHARQGRLPGRPAWSRARRRRRAVD